MAKVLTEDGTSSVKGEHSSGAENHHGDYELPKVSLQSNPRLPVFSGTVNKKDDTTYDVWKYELQCLTREKHHHPAAIIEALRRSLRGEAARVAMRLGPSASLTEIVVKLDSVYGNVDEASIVMGRFYSARQQPGESVADWGCRLEDLLEVAVDAGKVMQSEKDELLRSMLWAGLDSTLKDVTRHLLDSVPTFDKLLVALRQVEKDRMPTKSAKVQQLQPSTQPAPDFEKRLANLEGMIRQMSAKLDHQPRDPPSAGYPSNAPYQPSPSSQHGPQASHHGPPPFQHGSSFQQPHRFSAPGNRPPREPPRCWNCGEPGHLRSGCRKGNLNFNRPLGGARPQVRR